MVVDATEVFICTISGQLRVRTCSGRYGTTDIAVGDFITAFTTVEIGQKGSAGQTAIAIALEAYTNNDSSGVIDALIIPPRYI